MKILQIIQGRQLRGAEIFACQLASELIRMGHRVDVLYLFDQQDVLSFDIPFISLKAQSGKRFWDIGAYRRLNRIIRDGNYDVVQSNAGDTLKYAAISKMIFRWKTPLIYRNANKISDFLNSHLKFHLNKLFVRQIDHVISVSELCRNDFVKTFNISPAKIDTVEIGINLNTVDSLEDEASKLFSDGPVLLHVGSFVREKNHEGLLTIFSKVLRLIPDAKLVLIGKGKLENDIKIRAASLGVDNKVFFLGNRTDVQPIMYSSQVFLLPSLIEGLPAVILEAQFNRVPVIAYDVGGISEIVRNGETGWLIKKNDEESFVRAVIESIGDRTRIEKITHHAYWQVVNRYDNVKIAERFCKIYLRTIHSQNQINNGSSPT